MNAKEKKAFVARMKKGKKDAAKGKKKSKGGGKSARNTPTYLYDFRDFPYAVRTKKLKSPWKKGSSRDKRFQELVGNK